MNGEQKPKEIRERTSTMDNTEIMLWGVDRAINPTLSVRRHELIVTASNDEPANSYVKVYKPKQDSW